MPGILDRLDPTHDSDATGQSSFSGHEVYAVFQLRANGIITEPQAIAALQLDTDGEADLTWITGKYTSASDKNKFLSTVHAATMAFRSSLPGATRQWVINAINQAM